MVVVDPGDEELIALRQYRHGVTAHVESCDENVPGVRSRKFARAVRTASSREMPQPSSCSGAIDDTAVGQS